MTINAARIPSEKGKASLQYLQINTGTPFNKTYHRKSVVMRHIIQERFQYHNRRQYFEDITANQVFMHELENDFICTPLSYREI